MKDWELPAEEIAKLPRSRAIAAIANGVIEEFGRKEGPKRICQHIYGLFAEHAEDPACLTDAALWSNTLEAVCKERGIRFDAKMAVVNMLTNRQGDKRAGRIIKRARMALRKWDEDRNEAFEGRMGPLSDADKLHARGMGITWGESPA